MMVRVNVACFIITRSTQGFLGCFNGRAAAVGTPRLHRHLLVVSVASFGCTLAFHTS